MTRFPSLWLIQTGRLRRPSKLSDLHEPVSQDNLHKNRNIPKTRKRINERIITQPTLIWHVISKITHKPLPFFPNIIINISINRDFRCELTFFYKRYTLILLIKFIIHRIFLQLPLPNIIEGDRHLYSALNLNNST